MAYKGYIGEIPAGDGGANFDQNAGRVPITDLTDADGVITQDGLLQKEPGAALFGESGFKAQATLSAASQWGVAAVSLKGSGIAYVAASVMTNNAVVGAGPDFKVELTVPAGGIAAGSCIVVSSHLFTMRNDSSCVCTDDAGNTYTRIGPTGPTTVTRIFVALNVLALTSGQKIKLTFDALSMDLHHVAIANEFTGILTSSAIDKSGINDGSDAVPDFLYDSLSSVPQVLLMAGNVYEPATRTVTANLGFAKCGEATNGPGISHNRGWQQYRIDTTYVRPQLFIGAPVIVATLAGGNPVYKVTLGASLTGSSIARVAASLMTSVASIPATAPYRIQLTVPAGGIAAGSCIAVSSCLRVSDVPTCTCADDAGNVYVEVIGRQFQVTYVRLFIALNALALTSGQKITLTFNAASKGNTHVAIANEFTGITATGAVDRTAQGVGTAGYTIFLPLGSISSVPQLILGVGGFNESIPTTTVTPGDGFTLCGDVTAAPIPAAVFHSWQQYKVDSSTPTVVGLHDWRPTSTVQRVITATLGGAIYKEVDGDLDAILLTSGLSSTARPGKFVEGGQEAVTLPRKLFYFNGTDTVRRLSGDGGASSMVEISKPAYDWSSTNQPVSGMIQRNRLAAWGNKNHPHALYLSTVGDHEDFQTNTGADVTLIYTVYPSIGDRIFSGAKYLGLLWLFKWPRGIFWFDDSDPDSGLWSVQQQTDALGCAPTPYGALGIDNDIMFLSASGHFHLMSAVQGGVVRDSNLSYAMRHAKWLRDHVNLSKLSQAISVWYPHKKWAIWGLPSTGSTTNDLVVLFDFSEVTQSSPLPKLFISNRDSVDALALRLEADQIERPLLGEGGVVWLLDREARNKDGQGYVGKYKTARTDFSFVEKRFAAREKLFEHLEIVKTPTSGTLTVEVEIDGTVTETVTFDLSLRRQRKRIGGHGFELALIAQNSEADENFLIERHLVFFQEGEEGRI